MNILLCGADGFLGRAIAARLVDAGHRIIRGVHHPVQPGDVAIDYRADLTPESWLPRLEKIDAVINAVGILREREENDFAYIHHQSPAALFRAAALSGIKKVVQISAFGDPTATPYLASKQAADAALLATLPENALIIRPSLVFGVKGASTQFFLTLASLPFHFIPRGAGKLQPVHVDDIAEAVTRFLNAQPSSSPSPSHSPSRIVNLPGPRAMDYAEWMGGYRRLMGLPPAIRLPVPAFVMEATARCAGGFRDSFLCRDTWTMMKLGNCAAPDGATALLGRPLRDPADFAPREEAARLRLAALAVWRRPMLIGVLAAIWFLTALLSAGIFPVHESLKLLQAFGLTGAAALATLVAATALDALMGMLTLLRPCRKLWGFQLALIVLYTALVAWQLPEFLLHPFGPILKNLAIVVLLIQLFSEEISREKTA